MKLPSLVLSILLVGCTYSEAVVREAKPVRLAGVGIECAYDNLSRSRWEVGVASIQGLKRNSIRLSMIGDNAIIAVLDFDADGALIYLAATNTFPETYEASLRSVLNPCGAK